MLKKIILSFFTILFIATSFQFSFADRYSLGKTPKELEDYFWGMRYDVVQGTITVSGSSATLRGFGTNFSILAAGGNISWYGSWNTGEVGQLLDGYSFSDNFHVPVDSPTWVNFTIPSGATVYYRIGGLRK